MNVFLTKYIVQLSNNFLSLDTRRRKKETLILETYQLEKNCGVD